MVKIDEPMIPVNIRVPVEIKEKAQKLVQEYRKKGKQLTESAVYRQAIADFFSQERLQNVTDLGDGV